MTADPPLPESTLPPHIRRFAPWTWTVRSHKVLVAILICLYAPFSWLLIERDPYWLRMWPILPGLVPGALLFHPHQVLEFTAMGLTTLVLIAGLTWLGRWGRWPLMLAITLALLIGGTTSWLAYGLYWF